MAERTTHKPHLSADPFSSFNSSHPSPSILLHNPMSSDLLGSTSGSASKYVSASEGGRERVRASRKAVRREERVVEVGWMGTNVVAVVVYHALAVQGRERGGRTLVELEEEAGYRLG